MFRLLRTARVPHRPAVRINRITSQSRRASTFYHHTIKPNNSRTIRRIVIGSGLFIGAASGLYFASHQDTVPITERRRLMAVSRSIEAALGASGYESELNANAELLLPADHSDTKLVVRIVNRILAVTDLEGAKPSISVIDAATVNALCYPGGKIVVYTGLIRHLEHNNKQLRERKRDRSATAGDAEEEDTEPASSEFDNPTTHSLRGAELLEHELAVILAHEVSHAVARHSAETLSYAAPIVLAGLVLDASPLLSFFYNLGVTLPHSRTHETEADQIGLYLLSRANYNPHVAPVLWKKMHSCPEELHYFSTHPADLYRAANIEKWIPDAVAAAKEYKRQNPDPPQKSSWWNPFSF